MGLTKSYFIVILVLLVLEKDPPEASYKKLFLKISQYSLKNTGVLDSNTGVFLWLLRNF